MTACRAPCYEVLLWVSALIENCALDDESRCVNGVKFGET